jgi:hypothetical protein
MDPNLPAKEMYRFIKQNAEHKLESQSKRLRVPTDIQWGG